MNIGEFSMRGPYWLDLDEAAKAGEFFRRVGCDEGGVRIMARKTAVRPLYLRDVKTPAANILKQHMLSLGGDAAVARHAVNHGAALSDVILLGTLRQYGGLPERLSQQPWELQTLGKTLETLLARTNESRSVCWSWKDRKLVLGDGHTKILGILNVTPDSFSDGGKYNTVDRGVVRALEMIREGADAVDLGGVSTRPGHEEITVDEELERVMPVLERLLRETPAPISIDTWRAPVAEAALKAGAHILNDEGGGLKDPAMPETAAKRQAPVIAMHWPAVGTVYSQIAMDVADSLRESVNAYEGAGLSPEKLMLDPGVGFEKNAEESLALMRDIETLKALGKPILIGASRKRLIGAVLETPVDQRLEGSLAVAAWSFMKGMDMVRVHDVRQTKALLRMLEALAGREPDSHDV
jgi:dihydropteroate synthase